MWRIVIALIPVAAAATAAGMLAGTSSDPRAQAPRCDPRASAFGVLHERGRSPGRLARLSPRTLERRSRGTPLRGYYWRAERSPDGRALAVGLGNARVQIVDSRSTATLRTLRLGARGAVTRLAWVSADRLVALVGTGPEAYVAVADPFGRGLLARHRLGGIPQESARMAGGIAAVVARDGRIAPARLVLAPAHGPVRTLALDRIAAGFEPPPRNIHPGPEFLARHRQPGLAVEPSGRRVVVIGAGGGLVADVDVAGGKVEYHELDRARSLTARLRDWIEPPAHAKLSAGARRTALWLPNGLIAVSGDEQGADADTPFTPHGLRLIDPDAWTEQTVDADPDAFQQAGGALLAWRPYGRLVLRAYELDGRRRFELALRPRDRFFGVSGCFAYTGSTRLTRAIDLRTGRVVGTLRRGPVPPLLLP